MIITFTGTRAGMSPAQKQQFEDVMIYWSENFCVGECEFHHGAAVGADTEAVAHVVGRGYFNHYKSRIVPHPAGADPLARNREMIDGVPYDEHPLSCV